MRHNISKLEGAKYELEMPKLAYQRRGSTGVGCLLTLAAMPTCAYLGTYIGEGAGWLWGHLIDVIPLVRNLAPWCAERVGLIQNITNTTDLNVNLYQTTGAIGGFWSGLLIPPRILAKWSDD